MNEEPDRSLTAEDHGPSLRLDVGGLGILFGLVRQEVDEVIGPRLRDGTIALAPVRDFADLPVGYQDLQAPGHYELKQGGDPSYFQYAVGPTSPKQWLHPPRQRLWSAVRSGDGWTLEAEPSTTVRRAFFGVRSCDVESISTLDGVLLGQARHDPAYALARESLLLVTASCPRPSEVCFCTSMGHGPQPRVFDVDITEIHEPPEHFFVARAGSERGRALLDALEQQGIASGGTACRRVSAEDHQAVGRCLARARARISRHLDTRGLPEALANRLEASGWQALEDRCLACGNCTMVCPTCYCSNSHDQTSLDGASTERWQEWDSCFNGDFSYVHGGRIRGSIASRYRQWLTHKLSSWHEQFGRSGCVGCGRCVTWCPVGIDIVEEAGRIRG